MRSRARVSSIEADDVFCGTPPLAFTFGLGGMLCFPLRFGASTVLIEKPAPETRCSRPSATSARRCCFTAPTFYRQMAPIAQELRRSRSLKKCVSAGEALPDATRQLFKQATGIEIIDGIGSTEMIHIFISHAPDRVRRGATGYAIPGYRATVLDDDGLPCPPGVVGRLAVKGPTGCKYLADDRQRNYVQNGWNVTGDAYVMDADGYFFYQARTDDMIVSAGYNIAGPEVESALLAHAAVAECGVVGAPDEERGMIVKAYVVLKPGHRRRSTRWQRRCRITSRPQSRRTSIRARSSSATCCRAPRPESCSGSGCGWRRRQTPGCGRNVLRPRRHSLAGRAT